MKNADMPAMPVVTSQRIGNVEKSTSEATGLTKREMFAIHAMQAIISAPSDKFNPCNASVAAQYAVELAEAMIAELDSASK